MIYETKTEDLNEVKNYKSYIKKCWAKNIERKCLKQLPTKKLKLRTGRRKKGNVPANISTSDQCCFNVVDQR